MSPLASLPRRLYDVMKAADARMRCFPIEANLVNQAAGRSEGGAYRVYGRAGLAKDGPT